MASDIWQPQMVTTATEADVRREASSRQGRGQNRPIRRMGHRGKGGWGTAAVPDPDYGFNTEDLVSRQGAPVSPVPLVNGTLGGRYADLFSAVIPPTNASVFWQPENVQYNVDVGGGVYLFMNDTSLYSFFDGPKTSSAGSPSYVLVDGPCTVAFLTWYSATVGGAGYAPFCSIIEPTGGWGRDFSYSTTNVATTGEVYITYKPGAPPSTLYGTAASPNQSFYDKPSIQIFRQTGTTAAFSVLNYYTGALYPGGYSEARVPTGNTLRVRVGVNSGEATTIWRSIGVLAWQTGAYLSDADIWAAVTAYLVP